MIYPLQNISLRGFLWYQGESNKDDGDMYTRLNIAMIKNWRGTMTDAKVSYISAVALDNKDKGHEWVFQWIDETHNYKKGKPEHKIYHEDYRLENGKIREAFQYAQAVPEKK